MWLKVDLDPEHIGIMLFCDLRRRRHLVWSYGFYHPHTNVGLPQGGARRATPESRAIRPGQPLCVALCPTAALRYHSSVGWNTWFRKRRMRRFACELQVTAATRV